MSSGQKAPTPFQPPNQAGAASAFQTGAGQLANIGNTQTNQVIPQLTAISSAVQNNPFAQQALAGAQQAANTATGTVAPQQLAGAAQDTGIANLATSAAPGAYNAATNAGQTAYNQSQSLIPSGLQGLSVAPGVFNQAQSLIPSTTQPELQAGASVLNTAFDPQQALYNQQYQQMLDQQNAMNAMNGVAGSPYAAGISGQAGTNFNIDWQNAQLNRQIAGLGAYDQAAQTAAGDLSQLQTTGVNNFNALNTGALSNFSNLSNTGTSALNSGINTGVGALSTLGNTAIGANSAASDLGTAALNTQAGAAQLPSDVYLQQQQANLAATLAQIQGTNAATQPLQQSIADQGQYLNIGQTASQGAIQAASTNNQQTNAQAQGLGSLFGDVTSMFLFTK